VVSPAQIPAAEARARARRIRMLLTDCDGVLTDAGVYYSDLGETLKRFSVRDGMGVERLREAGIATAILTRERSRCVERRAEKLGLPFIFQGIADKRGYLPAILDQTGLEASELALIGDDVNDVGALAEVCGVGLTACPADAMPEALEVAHFRCALRGGHGAFREFAEWILNLRRQASAELEGACAERSSASESAWSVTESPSTSSQRSASTTTAPSTSRAS
jgi:3-deoxy-D-manno-octulosonate 8-phosphate phosphatase (KDO 8-P phosphatase)